MVTVHVKDISSLKGRKLNIHQPDCITPCSDDKY